MDRNYEQQRVAQLRDFSPDEITAFLPLEIANQLDLHQQCDMRHHNTPTVLWPPEVAQNHPEVINVLTNNIGLYEDDMEKAMMQDGLLQDFLVLRQHEPNDPQIAAAIRARRTILVRLLNTHEATVSS